MPPPPPFVQLEVDLDSPGLSSWRLAPPGDPARYSQYLLQLIVTVPAPVIGFRNKGFWFLEAQEKMRRRKHRTMVESAFKPGSPRHCLSLGPTSWFYYGHPENEVSNHRVPSLALIKHLLCARNRAKANRVKPAHPLLPQPSKTFRFPRCLGRCQWWGWFQNRLEALSLTRWLTSSWKTRKEKWKGSGCEPVKRDMVTLTTLRASREK